MTLTEYEKLPAKNNWTPEVKQGTSSILEGDSSPPVLLQHIAVAAVHSVKVCGQYGLVMKQYKTACKVINHGLTINRVVVPNHKLGGQHLCVVQHDMLQTWVETLCESFSGDDSDRHYQGDGIAPPEITLDGTGSGVTAHTFTDVAEKTADQLYSHLLPEVKAQKALGAHLLSNSDRTKQRMETNLLGNIYHVTAGKLLLLFLLRRWSLLCLSLYCISYFFIYLIGFPANVEHINVPSPASSVTNVPEILLFSPTPAESAHNKCKSPPTVSTYPIRCLSCFETSNVFLKADYDLKTVKCLKCTHVAMADQYDQSDFVKACFYDSNKQQGATSGFKKHQETAYLSILADLKRGDNENKHLDLKKEELRMKEIKLERLDVERHHRLEQEIFLEEKRQSTQADFFKLQSESTALCSKLSSA
jgi:hypothetical protein